MAIRISDLYKQDRPIYSFEFFPPKTTDGEQKLHATIKELKSLSPDYVSITCGAGGGANQSKTLDWAIILQEQYEINAMLHHTSIGITQKDLDATMIDVKNAGIINIMALRGDYPNGSCEYKPSKDGFSYANELIEYIKKSNNNFCIGGACYPEVHIQAKSAEEDLRNLNKKVIAGANFLITQLFFSNEKYFNFVKKCRDFGIHIPIVPGIMPITNYKQIERFTQMAGCYVPEELIENIKSCDDESELFEISFKFTLKQCIDLLNKGAPGIHFYTLNQSKLTRMVLMELNNYFK